MKPILQQYKNLQVEAIYSLLKNVYTTSDSMSESFDEKFPDKESCNRYFSELDSQRGSILLFAEINNEPVGYLVIKPRYQAKIRHTSELNMGIHSGFRDSGVGKFLLTEALKMAMNSKENEIIYLMVRADNFPAIRLYEQFGFDKLATLERDTKIGNTYYDGILMRKFVDSPSSKIS
jgi:ribosomal protein S18 acetylase RimI-like enzyme